MQAPLETTHIIERETSSMTQAAEKVIARISRHFVPLSLTIHCMLSAFDLEMTFATKMKEMFKLLPIAVYCHIPRLEKELLEHTRCVSKSELSDRRLNQTPSRFFCLSANTNTHTRFCSDLSAEKYSLNR